jgi:hypothetical protein
VSLGRVVARFRYALPCISPSPPTIRVISRQPDSTATWFLRPQPFPRAPHLPEHCSPFASAPVGGGGGGGGGCVAGLSCIQALFSRASLPSSYKQPYVDLRRNWQTTSLWCRFRSFRSPHRLLPFFLARCLAWWRCGGVSLGLVATDAITGHMPRGRLEQSLDG